MRPALTPKQWGEFPPNPDKYWQHDSCVPMESRERHYVAAVNLYGQPFGFDRSDVRELRSTADDANTVGGAWLESIADRIEALLPPEEP